MRLAGRLKGKREVIVDRWADLALAVYPLDSTGFFRQEKDRFRNPVGHATRTALGLLFDGLLEQEPPERMQQTLDGIARIRAVQELSPSAALGFVFQLKRAVREALGPERADASTPLELEGFEDRIDHLALEAFEVYVRCREQVYDLRLGEIKRRNAAILQGVNPAEGCGKGGC